MNSERGSQHLSEQYTDIFHLEEDKLSLIQVNMK